MLAFEDVLNLTNTILFVKFLKYQFLEGNNSA